jgi:hypothetical protein
MIWHVSTVVKVSAMSEIHRIQSAWEIQSGVLEQEKEALARARAPMAMQVAEFHANKPDGMWGKLSHAFTKATKIASVNRKVAKLDGQIADKNAALREEAGDAYRQFGEFALAQMGSDGTTLRANYDHLKETKQKLVTAVAAVDHAIKESKDASDWEGIDMMSNNFGFSMLSHLETREAVDAMKGASAALTDLNKNLREQERFDKSIPDDLQSDNNFDLFVDALSEFAGIFTSWSNMEKLDNAVEKMGQIQKSLGEIGREIDGSLRHTQTVAIQAVQKQHPALVDAVKAVSLLLPKETVAELKSGPRAFKL